MARYPKVLGAASVVVAADQITKTLALDRLADGPHDVIEGVVTMRLTYNSGGVFGLLQGMPGLFLVATLIVSGLILWWARGVDDPRLLIPLGLVLGGGLGNVADRIFRDTDGRVVDFVDLHVWPVFNVADASIVTGVGLILLFSLRPRREP